MTQKSAISALFVGEPQKLSGIATSIVRESVDRIQVLENFISGDRVANTKHHGGPNRVLHHFPAEHYAALSRLRPDLRFASGMIGENLSAQGLTEASVCVGDVFQIGEVRGVVTEPRKPCATINLRWATTGLARMVQENLLLGWFYRILEPGTIRVGDSLELIDRPFPDLSLQSCAEALLLRPNPDVLQKMMSNPVLSEGWKRTAKTLLETGVLPDDHARLGD